MEFALESRPGIILWVTADPSRIPPNGTSTSTITAHVTDLEGAPLQGKSVTITVDTGVLVEANPSTPTTIDLTTDTQGAAQCHLRSSTTSETATVTASHEGASQQTYVEFARADSPRVRVLAPTDGATVSGEVEIDYDYIDSEGTNPGILRMTEFVDGVEYSTNPGTSLTSAWYSFKTTNGTHSIWVIAEDRDRNTAKSNVIHVTVQNSFSEFQVTPDLVGSYEPVHISAKMAVCGDWRVTISDGDGNVVWETTGTGTEVSADWPGTNVGGMYDISVSAAGEGMELDNEQPAPTLPVGVNTSTSANVLLVSEEKDFSLWQKTMDRLEKIVTARGLTCKKLTPGKAPWSAISPILMNSNCRYFYFSGHGNWVRDGVGEVTHVFISSPESDGHPVVLYAHPWQGAPASGSPDPL